MEKLILPRKKIRIEKGDRGSIKVRESTMEIIDRRHEKSCLSKTEIMDRIIKFADMHTELEDEVYQTTANPKNWEEFQKIVKIAFDYFFNERESEE